MLKLLTVTLITSISIVIAVILNAWLLIPVIVSLYYLTKKFLSTEKTVSNTNHPVVRFGFSLAAAIFVTFILSGFLLFLLFAAYMLGFDSNKKCNAPIETINIIPCGLFWGNDEFRTNTRKITNSILPKINIKVRLFDGSIQPAKLTHRSAGVANLKSDDVLTLSCGINPKLDINEGVYGYASCHLTLPKAAPESTNYPEGLDAQHDWVLGANFQGITDPQILILPQPLVWPPNNATPINKYK
jgi:hypothetical protein